jgi:formylmethanofuran dehydrogenase subunit E
MNDNQKNLDELTAFHGHLCPGLAIGYRATKAGLKRLGVDRAQDEELVVIVENDSCSVDAVQFLAGATFGKGNLFFRDWGKQVFTFARRGRPGAVRISLKAGAMSRPEEQSRIADRIATGEATEAEIRQAADWRQEKIQYLLSAPVEDLFDIREVEIEIPPTARIFRSVNCDRCGEPVMETRTIWQGDEVICLECDSAQENG